jgi:hypothetical protein
VVVSKGVKWDKSMKLWVASFFVPGTNWGRPAIARLAKGTGRGGDLKLSGQVSPHGSARGSREGPDYQRRTDTWEKVLAKSCGIVHTFCGMKRATQQTSSAAVLAVGAELSRRGYDVAFTLGNTRKVDLLCSVPDGSPFKTQVKGISNPNGFYIDKSFFEGAVQEDLFLVVVLVPKDDASPFRFFVLSHEEAKKEFGRMPTHKRDGRPYEHGSGLNWGPVSSYENTWGKFPPVNKAEHL